MRDDTSATPMRVTSVDVLRGVVVLVMIFVNDVAGVRGAPAWMKHLHPSTADGMTFVDVVFPAFLFMVGVAIPLSIGRRLDAGEPLRSVWRSILVRVLALLVIGVLMVNTETIAKDGPISATLWTFLMYVGVLLVWTRTTSNNRVGIQRAVGIALLLALVVLYRGNDATSAIQLRPQWWGILGLIGWAYLVGCAAYIFARRELGALIGIAAILYVVYFADAVGFFAWAEPIDRWVDFGGMLGSQGAITVSGVALGVMLAPGSRWESPGQRIRWGLLFGAGLFVAGLMLHALNGVHPAFIINKNAATPAWCLLSSAYTAWLWVLIYWLVDVRGWKGWAVAVRPAGEHPLFAYVLSYLFYATLEMLLLLPGARGAYEGMWTMTAAGIIRALVVAFGIVWLTGWLTRRGLRFRV